jgi:16S rRNA (adenine(1408)-N(1))-methyltransferase
MAAWPRVSIDIGAGDGRAVLALARAEPGALALGIDPDASRMSDAASRSARKPSKGGAPNARFLVCAVEALPMELAATADLVTVQFPWGSLLRGIVGGETAILAPIARLLKPSADSELRLLLSVEPRDRAVGLGVLDEHAVRRIANAFTDLGLEVREARPASAADLAASHSTWAKRLRAGSGERKVWALTTGVGDVQRRYAREADRDR